MNSLNISALVRFMAMLTIILSLSGCAGFIQHRGVTDVTPEIYDQQKIEEGDFTTLIGQATLTARSSKNRMSNMALACSTINNHTVTPNETFSFNQVVGRRTPERGYKEAPVIVNKKHVKGIGGGICQVSSTLYNAVKDNPNIAIVERHRHSTPVSYTENDATVSYGSKDFKFKNNYKVPIIIHATAHGGTVQIKIYK